MVSYRRLALLAAVLGVLGLPVAAQAVVTLPTITFDGPPAGTLVSDQYPAIGFGSPHRWGIDAGVPDTCAGEGGVGVQHIQAAGITGASLADSCSGRPPGGPDSGAVDLGFALAGKLATEASSVAFGLRVVDDPDDGGAPVETGPFAVRIRFLTITGAPITGGDQTVTVASGVPTTVTSPAVTTSTEIGFVVVSGRYGEVQIDDISIKQDDTPPPAKYTLALPAPNLSLAEGESGTVPVQAVRFNGSTGQIPVTIPALPAGIAAAVVQGGGVGGTATAPLLVTAGGPATGDRQITLTGGAGAPPSAGTFIGAPVILTVHISPALAFDRQTVGATPGCGSVSTQVGATIRGGYSDSITATFVKLSGPATVTSASTSFPHDGSVLFPITVSSPASDTPSTYEVRITAAGLTPITGALAVYSSAAETVSISGVENTLIYHAPYVAAQHYGVIVRGSFPDGSCPITFKDDTGTVLPRGAAAPQAPGQDPGYRLDLGTDPVATRIHAVGPGNVELAVSARIDVLEYRNTVGLRQANASPAAGISDLSWNEFVSAFGTDDAENCFADICWDSPTASAYYERYKTLLQGQKGLCFGYAAQSVSFFTQTELPRQFAAGATSGYALSSFANADPILRNVAIWHIRQFDYAYRIAMQRQIRTPLTTAGVKQAIDDALARNQPPLLDLWKNPYATINNSGHTVVAYDVRDAADGGIDIVTYNPNIPYASAEETSALTRSSNLASSLVHVTPAGIWTGGIAGWTGPLSQLEVVGLPSLNASLPIDLPTIATSGSAAIGQVVVDGHDAFSADGRIVPGRGVTDQSMPTGGAPAPEYGLTGDEPARVRIVGDGRGAYTHTLVGGRVAATVEGARTEEGQTDAVTVRPDHASLAFASGGGAAPVTLRIDARGGSAAGSTGRRLAPAATGSRSVRIVMTAGGGRSDVVAIASGGVVALRHFGAPTRASISLTGTASGLPASATYAPIELRAGQRLALRPTSWGAPGRGASFAIADVRGRIVRRGHARVLASPVVRLGTGLRVKATAVATRAAAVTVSGRILRRGAATTLVIAVRLLRGTHRISVTTVRRSGAAVRTGSFKVRVPLPRLAHRRRVEVTVLLLDTTSGLTAASKKGTLNVR
jgi:hypothetical protein